MRNNEVLSLLPDIYDSALDSSTWGGTLDKITHVAGAKGALLLVVDQQNESGLQVSGFSQLWTDIPEIITTYNEKYLQYEQAGYDMMFQQPRQKIILDTEVWVDVPDLINRPDYKYLRGEVGIVRRLAARLNDNKSWLDLFTLHMDEKYETVPDHTIAVTRQILAHAAKSVELSRTFHLLKSRYNAVLTALDHVEIGLCVAMRSGEVLVSNAEAKRILEQQDGIGLSPDGKITSDFPEQGARIQQAIEQASATAHGENTAHEMLLVSERRSGADSVLIEISPLRDYARELDPLMAGALVTLIDPVNSKPFDVTRTAAAYNLTPAESEVCRLMVEGKSTPVMGEMRGVSAETIKTQVQKVMNKTGCSKRSDLIRLALKTTPPVSAPVSGNE